MKTVLMSGLLVALLASVVPTPASAQARERGVNARQHHQSQRFQEGWRQGDLARREARGLERAARDVRREERAFRSDGRFTPAERREVHRDLDRLSRDIRHERHDGERRFSHRGPGDRFGHGTEHRFGHHGAEHRFPRHDAHARFGKRSDHPVHGEEFARHQLRPAWSGSHDPRQFRAFNGDPRIDWIQQRQHDRIVQGIRSGELTRREAHGLIEEQRAIRAEERAYLADGVLTRAERGDLYEDLSDARRHIYNETHDAQIRR
ncbi:MAG: hypothetical protein HYU76_06565 [Betaproteobacteria bacterium]|nr:hypothetical protein [Betaproteobacteria bacterium]